MSKYSTYHAAEFTQGYNIILYSTLNCFEMLRGSLSGDSLPGHRFKDADMSEEWTSAWLHFSHLAHLFGHF